MDGDWEIVGTVISKSSLPPLNSSKLVVAEAEYDDAEEDMIEDQINRNVVVSGIERENCGEAGKWKGGIRCSRCTAR